MKRLISIVLTAVLASLALSAQQPMDEGDRLAIGVERPLGISGDNAARTLRNNITNALILNGISAIESRFTTVTDVVEISKDVTGSAPAMFVTELEISIFIIDLYTGIIFGQTSFNIKGIGDNEGASYLDAIRNVKARNPKLKTLINSTKDKILEYFYAESDQILGRIDAYIASGDYDAALIEANAIPRACTDIYDKVSQRIAAIPATAVRNISKETMDRHFFNGSRDERIANIVKL